MNPWTISRTALFIFLMTTMAAGADKTPPTYQQGTIKGWEKGTDIYWVGAHGETFPRDKTVYELKGTDMVYLIDYCGSFQAGKFSLGQTVNYRVDETDEDDRRLYIGRDNGEEYKCKIEGQKMLERGKNDVPSTAPAAPPAAAPSVKP